MSIISWMDTNFLRSYILNLLLENHCFNVCFSLKFLDTYKKIFSSKTSISTNRSNILKILKNSSVFGNEKFILSGIHRLVLYIHVANRDFWDLISSWNSNFLKIQNSGNFSLYISGNLRPLSWSVSLKQSGIKHNTSSKD